MSLSCHQLTCSSARRRDICLEGLELQAYISSSGVRVMHYCYGGHYLGGRRAIWLSPLSSGQNKQNCQAVTWHAFKQCQLLSLRSSFPCVATMGFIRTCVKCKWTIYWGTLVFFPLLARGWIHQLKLSSQI